MANNSTGSSQGQRRHRQVGLANPRSARGRANEEEVERVAIQNASHRDQNHQEVPRVVVQNFPRRGANEEEVERVAIQNIVRSGDMGLDILGYEDSESDSSLGSIHSRALTPGPQDEDDRDNDSDIHQSPPEVVAARARARNRYFWQGNDGKLNLMASKYLNQPLRQEIAANASGNAVSIAQIRLLKRDAAQDLDHNNLKHSGTIAECRQCRCYFIERKSYTISGKLFLVQATTDELNACEAFREYLPESQTLSVELCRQKIKEFQAIAVGTPDASIDRRMFH